MNIPKLKKKGKKEEYEKTICAISRCFNESVCIDASGNIWDCEVPLCQKDLERIWPNE